MSLIPIIKEYLKPKMPKFTFLNIMVIIACLSIIVSTITPTDYYLRMPGSAVKLNERVEIGERKSENSFYAVTVREIRARAFHHLIARLSSKVGLYPIYFETEISDDAMDESRDTAITLTSRRRRKKTWDNGETCFETDHMPYYGAEVTSLTPGISSPLQPGDIIIKANNIRIRNHYDLRFQSLRLKPGDEIELRFFRPPEFKQKQAVVSLIEHKNRKTFGFELQEYDPFTEIDPRIKVEMNDIEGGSAGLMLSLEIMNQQSETDLTGGYLITGTGFLTKYGEILVVDGLKYKIYAAERAGMDYFLCPADNYNEAVNIASRVKIIAVKNLECAEDFLAGLKENSR